MKRFVIASGAFSLGDDKTWKVRIESHRIVLRLVGVLLVVFGAGRSEHFVVFLICLITGEVVQCLSQVMQVCVYRPMVNVGAE